MRSFIAIFAAVMAFLQVAVAIPPACLLNALGLQGNPTDLKALCGDLLTPMQGNLTESCDSAALPEAYEVYSSKCLAEGVTIAGLPTSTASGSSSTGTASATGPNSASATATDGATATGSGSSSTETPASAGMAVEPQSFLFTAAVLLASGLISVMIL